MGQIGTDNNLMGILCFAVGMFLFSAVDTMAKFLTTDFHPVQVAWGRQVGMFLGVLVLFAIRGPNLFRSAAPFLQIGRGVFAACSALLFIMAVAVVPLADAAAVSFVAPFIVTVLGALILKESVGIRRWSAIVIGFLATLIIIRPGLGVFDPAIFLVVIAATFYAGRQILSRILSGSDSTETTIAYTAVAAFTVLTLPLPFVWATPESWQHLGLFLLLTLLAGAAEVFVIRSLELAQAVVLAPVHYTIIIWGTFYGWIVFGQLPDGWTWLGAGIIFVTGIYLIRREYSLGRRGLK